MDDGSGFNSYTHILELVDVDFDRKLIRDLSITEVFVVLIGIVPYTK